MRFREHGSESLTAMCDSAMPHFHAVWTADDRYSRVFLHLGLSYLAVWPGHVGSKKREYCQSKSWSITCPFGIPTYVELVKGARMRQAGTTNHTLDNDGGDETLQRNGLDTCPTSSMLKQMLVSFSAIARK